MGEIGSKSMVYSIPVEGSQTTLSSPIYRHPDTHSSIILPKVWGCTNFFEVFK